MLNHQSSRSQLQVSLKVGIFKNLANFTGKHLRQILFFNNVAGLKQLY